MRETSPRRTAPSSCGTLIYGPECLFRDASAPESAPAELQSPVDSASAVTILDPLPPPDTSIRRVHRTLHDTH